MLAKALQFLEKQLNAFVSIDGEPSSVVLSSVANEKGEVIVQAGQLALTLVNIEEEKILKTQPPKEKVVGDSVQFANPEIKLNLLMMLAANPGADKYAAALEALSKAILFFQGTSVFNKVKFPDDFPAEIEKLTVELFSLSMEQQNQLWASLGAKYLPSVVYKLRLLVIDRNEFGGDTPVIKAIDNQLHKLN